ALRAQAFDEALATFLGNGSPERRLPELDLAAAYTPDRLERIVLAVHDEVRSRGEARPSLPRPTVADPAGARAALDVALAEASAELAGAAPGAAVGRARDAVDACRELLDGLAEGETPALPRLAPARFKPGASAALKGSGCARYLEALAAYEQALAAAEAAGG